MFKQVALAGLILGLTSNAIALDKTKVSLDQVFWGTWSVYNSKSKCTEVYSFAKPGKFTYTTRQKTMSGEFAVLRSKSVNELDVLAMKVVNDNKLAGCSGQVNDYTNADIRLSLKWLSPKSAELCTDLEGKACTGLFLNKQS
jgi:hypothetical protein